MQLAHLLCALAALGAAQASPAQPTRSQRSAGDAFVERGAVPVNGSDFCASAPSFTGFGLFPFDNTAATMDGMAHGRCTKDGGSQIAHDLWWRWTSPVTGPVTISTCGLTPVDTEIAVYAPNAVCAPGDEALILCDDQSCGSQTEITFVAIVGQQYLFRIGSYDGGDFSPGVVGVGQFSLSGQISATPSGVCQESHPVLNNGYLSNAQESVADDFYAPTDAVITFVRFAGDYSATGPLPGVDDFAVRYYADAGGIPGLLIAEYNAGNGLAVEGPVATGVMVEYQFTQFAYQAAHPPVAVSAGQRVWVEIRNFGSTWYWTNSLEGNESAYHDLGGGYGFNDLIEADLTLCVGPFESCPTDLTGDGATNFADLNAVLGSFGAACP